MHLLSSRGSCQVGRSCSLGASDFQEAPVHINSCPLGAPVHYPLLFTQTPYAYSSPIKYQLIIIYIYTDIHQMDSSELLQNLNKQSHKKHAKKQLNPVLEQPQNQSKLAQNQFQQATLPIQLPDPPSFLLQILEQQKRDKLLRKIYKEAIAVVRKQKQKNVYIAFIEQHLTYLGELNTLISNKNPTAHNTIGDIMTRRFNHVTSDLEEGKLIINRDRSLKKKKQVELLESLDRARLIKIKEGSIRSKLDLLNSRMEEMEEMEKIHEKQDQGNTVQEINKKIQENLDSVNYGLNSEKTKIAKDYVKYMTEQRRQKKQRQKLRQERSQKIEMERIAELKQAQEIKDQTKKKEILGRIQVKKQKREQQQRQMTQKQDKIEKFLSVYKQKMPIFKKKQKQFQQQYIKPERRYYEQKLKQIKQKKKSYSLSDMVEHQKRMQKSKKRQNQRKSLQKQMYKQSLKINTKQYYKGSIHEIVEQIDKERKQKNIALYQFGKNKQSRMLEYGKQVKGEHQPKVDQDKRKELVRLLEYENMKKNNLRKKYRQIVDSDGEEAVESFYQQLPKKNRYVEGNKHMEYAKLRRNRNVSQSMDTSIDKDNDKDQQSETQKNTVNALKNSISESKNNGNAYKQIWEIRSKQMGQMSNNLSSPKEFEQVKVNFQNLDIKAAQKQEVLRHARLSMDEHMDQKGALDNFYLESIKNKMKLLE